MLNLKVVALVYYLVGKRGVGNSLIDRKFDKAEHCATEGIRKVLLRAPFLFGNMFVGKTFPARNFFPDGFFFIRNIFNSSKMGIE